MPTAAANFSHGDGTESLDFFAGDEVPEEIASEIPPNLILENLAKADPDLLDRDQLMRLAGVGPYAADGPLEDETEAAFDEEAFLEAIGDFPNKGALIEWAAEFYPELALDDAMKRSELEEALLAYVTGEDEEE